MFEVVSAAAPKKGVAPGYAQISIAGQQFVVLEDNEDELGSAGPPLIMLVYQN
jgi:hypothetical protein